MTFKQKIKPLGKGKYKVVDSDQTIDTRFQGDLMRYKTICYGQKVNADLFRVFVDNMDY